MFFNRENPGEALLRQAREKLYDRKHFRLAYKADAGDIEAGYVMGRYHLCGSPNIDHTIGLRFLQKPARAGHPEARVLAILTLLDGCNGENSSFSAWCILLKCRLDSFPIEQWFVDEATAEGNAIRVVVCLDQMFRGCGGTALSAYAALVNYAMEGSPPAMATLGYCNATGTGTTQDFEQAYVCFSVAHALGMKSAASDRDRIGCKLPPDRLVGAQARASNTLANIMTRIAAQHDSNCRAAAGC